MLGLSLWEGRLPGQKTIENEDKAQAASTIAAKKTKGEDAQKTYEKEERTDEGEEEDEEEAGWGGECE